MNEELELEKEKLVKKLENVEIDFKNNATYSYQEHFKKMFVKFLEHKFYHFSNYLKKILLKKYNNLEI